ncbi:MAG TPA: LacI family DNA-binding transcriptional regulator [Candidatus Limnocylindrales bacterium]|nr:LacI family DNA-binding transcriptional regulator [Candidatus Limnocylindrales bacterium]
MTARKSQPQSNHDSPVTLKAVSKFLGLSPGTVSAVLNNSPACRSVPEHTKKRIFAAARELNYKPNYLARALRVKRTYTIGVIAAEIGDPYSSIVISGVERYLRQQDFFFLTVVHRHDPQLLERYSRLLLERGVEGFITIDTSITEPPRLPAVAVAGHRSVEGVTNITIDHRTAVLCALQYLVKMGHREIAFMKGPDISSDAEDRWRSITEVAAKLGIRVSPELTVTLNDASGLAARAPEYGLPFAKELLSRRKLFTALFAYNDNSAIAAIRVFQEAGLRVPEDVSVVGFDDIQAAAYSSPALTTVRQPLEKMGEIAARTVLERIEGRSEYVPAIAIAPQFVVRKSTGHAPVAIPNVFSSQPDRIGLSAPELQRNSASGTD